MRVPLAGLRAGGKAREIIKRLVMRLKIKRAVLGRVNDRTRLFGDLLAIF